MIKDCRTYRARLLRFIIPCLFVCILSCGSSHEISRFPLDFSMYDDFQKAKWISSNMPPDSAATIIIEIMTHSDDEEIRFTDFKNLVREVYRLYENSDRIEFANTFNICADSLKPMDKMNLFVETGCDGLKIGYLYGLESLGKNDSRINDEMKALEEKCEDNPVFLDKFKRGLMIAGMKNIQ